MARPLSSLSARGATLPTVELRSGEQQLYEQQLYDGRPSWRALMSFYAAGFVIAALVLVILGALAGSWALAVILAAVIAGLTLVVGYLRRISTKYLITTQRLRISRGVIRPACRRPASIGSRT